MGMTKKGMSPWERKPQQAHAIDLGRVTSKIANVFPLKQEKLIKIVDLVQ